MPKYVDNWTGADGVWGGVGEREVRMNGREDNELNYQERVAMIWIEKVKSMGPSTLDGIERGRGCAQDRVILMDMLNIGMFKRVHKAASNPPVIVISSDIRTLGNRDGDGGRMVRVVRRTQGRRDSCRW